MVAARSGDRVVVIGAGDPVLSAELARVTGLNGQLTVIDDAPGARARTARAASRLGALVPFEEAPPTSLTAGANSADIAVLVRRSAR